MKRIRRQRYITITWHGITWRYYARSGKSKRWTAPPGCGWRHRTGKRRR